MSILFLKCQGLYKKKKSKGERRGGGSVDKGLADIDIKNNNLNKCRKND